MRILTPGPKIAPFPDLASVQLHAACRWPTVFANSKSRIGLHRVRSAVARRSAGCQKFLHDKLSNDFSRARGARTRKGVSVRAVLIEGGRRRTCAAIIQGVDPQKKRAKRSSALM